MGLFILFPAVTVLGFPYSLEILCANIFQADIEASNGVIHVIDTVLLPE
jgi:uncharacterized surface protein with fasciclin (FAS1) repeats